jgi:hypothetical protein
VADGKSGRGIYQKEDNGGRIINYNFGGDEPWHIRPENTDVVDLWRQEEPMLYIAEGEEIVPTQYGKELNLTAMDWQHGADEYLAALDQPPLDYTALEEMFQAKYAAMIDANTINFTSTKK